MKTKTISSPHIMTSFNHNLLSWTIGINSSLYYREIYKCKIDKIYKRDTKQYREYEMLLKVNQRLYEWKKAKEAYDKAENKEDAQRPTLSIEEFNTVRGLLGKTIREYVQKCCEFQ